MGDFRTKLGVEGGGYHYYGICTAGGMFSAGATHLAVTPLDVLKVNMQVNPIKFHSIGSGLNILWKEEGPSSLWRGWSGKLFGYGVQGGFKFGLYEFFKRRYTDVLRGERQSVVFFLSSASAQVFADMALCPFEAVKVRVQTQPNFAKGLSDGFPKLYALEGISGFYKGLLPLWGRNLQRSFLLLALAFAVVLLVASEMAAAKDLASKHDSEIDGGGYNNGGGRGGYNNGGGRGGHNGGGRGGHNGGGGGKGGGGGGRGGGGGGGGGGRGCKHGCCGGRYNHGGCKCCSTFAEATAYKQTQN